MKLPQTGPFKTKTGRRNIMISLVSYVIVVAITVRGLIQYPELIVILSILLGAFLLTMVFERFAVRRLRVLGTIYLGVQTSLMIGLYFAAPIADYWAILLMPSIIFAMRYFRLKVGIAWVVVFTVTMSVMIIYTEGASYALEYIVMYVAAYLLIASYSLMLKQTEAAGRESEALLAQLTETNLKLKEYAGRAEELAVFAERNRLARELHDSVTQTIFSMTLITRTALILQEKNPGQVTGKLEQLQELAGTALGEMRGLIFQLMPSPASEEGLIPVLRKHFDGLLVQSGLRVVLDLQADDLPLPPDFQQELFRIIQEALNNIVKHAQVQTASISIEQAESGLTVTISDKGAGFDTADVNRDGFHFGLENIHSRAETLGGRIDIRSAKGEGTDVIITIPAAEAGKKHE